MDLGWENRQDMDFSHEIYGRFRANFHQSMDLPSGEGDPRWVFRDES